MRRFKVRVNGIEYTVDIEEMVSGSDSQPSGGHQAGNPVAEKAPSAGGTEVKSPIQGTVVRVEVSAGDSVSAGDRVCVLEAMKMEYDITAPCAGRIAEVRVAKGSAAEEGTVLAVISPAAV
ncbi:MAG: acetyl-CoA carboxylase biotin carboxyl carrier protein subunit [Clostridia bacterium]|nr:acetyl-CoA carboxylase biotin carboxyl carrier protein subunit [Clostridia bacterium]